MTWLKGRIGWGVLSTQEAQHDGVARSGRADAGVDPPTEAELALAVRVGEYKYIEIAVREVVRQRRKK